MKTCLKWLEMAASVFNDRYQITTVQLKWSLGLLCKWGFISNLTKLQTNNQGSWNIFDFWCWKISFNEICITTSFTILILMITHTHTIIHTIKQFIVCFESINVFYKRMIWTHLQWWIYFTNILITRGIAILWIDSH